jgi:hypothetical protein
MTDIPVPTEDRSFGENRPYIDLTALHQWGAKVADRVGRASWTMIREHVARRVDHTCEFC